MALFNIFYLGLCVLLPYIYIYIYIYKLAPHVTELHSRYLLHGLYMTSINCSSWNAWARIWRTALLPNIHNYLPFEIA